MPVGVPLLVLMLGALGLAIVNETVRRFDVPLPLIVRYAS